MKIVATALVLWLATATIASAEIVSSSFEQVTSEAGFTPPAGFVTQDLKVQSNSDWLAANLIVTLTSGSIHQDALVAGIGPPSSALIAVLPALRWDTYVTGSLGLNGGAPASAGGAVDLGGTPAGAFSDSHIDLNWFTTATNDIGTFSLGRFTFSDTADGTFSLRLDSLNQSAPFFLTGTIENGHFTAVPEVSTLALSGLALGAAGLIIRRRKAV